MSTQKLEGQLEIDHDRGVIYFHSNKGYTALRIGGLPHVIPFVSSHEALDISHMHGCNWKGSTGPQRAEDLKRKLRALEEECREAGVLDQAAKLKS